MTQDLTAFLAALGPAQAAHRPWPRHILDRAGWMALLDHLASADWSLLGLWGEAGTVHLALQGGSGGRCIWRGGRKAGWRGRASSAPRAAIPPSRSIARAPSAWSARSAIS